LRPKSQILAAFSNVYQILVPFLWTQFVSQHFEGRYIANRRAVAEIGVAVVHSSGRKPQFIPFMIQFYEENHIGTLAIRMHKQPRGPVVGHMAEVNDEDAGSRLK
jgi:hypothetical protein